MNLWNKIFIGCITGLVLAVLLLGAVELKIRGTGLKTEDSLQGKIEQAESGIVKIKDGTAPRKNVTEKADDELSFEELRSKLTVQLSQRGRSWHNCIVSEAEESVKIRTLPPKPIDGADTRSVKPLQQVEVLLVITEPLVGAGANAVTAVPDALKGVVYAFKEGSGQNNEEQNSVFFLGRFTVTSAPMPTKYHDANGTEQNAYQVSLVTADPLSDDEIQDIRNADKAKWTLMLSPPKDVASNETDGDPDKRRDAAVALDYVLKERSELNNTRETLNSYIQTSQEAAKASDSENNKMQQDIAMEEKRAEAMQKNREAVNKTLKEYETAIRDLTLQSEKLQVLQAAYLAKIAQAQLQVKKKIEQEADAAVNAENK
ncbi:MAG: hypothetical protein LBT46_13470 [Planctomycetaceae bacterium]|jgi:hypothetical protein|nr:hypothetical protein [Planctomycetaceae bacterium]